MKSHALPLYALSTLLAACGGGTAEPVAPESGAAVSPDAPAETAPLASAPAAAAEPSGPAAIPTECHEGRTSPCTADPRWAKRLCADVYPAVALYLNQPSSPFSRGYLTRKTKAVNATGGATSGSEWLAFDEQVVLVHYRGADLGGMSVSGAEGGYDAIRWDGSCVTLDASEVRLERAPSPVYARIDWRYLGEDLQDALKALPEVRDAYVARKQECKGAYSGEVSQKCVQRDKALEQAIVRAVTSGAVTLPVPALRP
jgi:hypothetical protein